jgi:hypothetical protein
MQLGESGGMVSLMINESAGNQVNLQKGEVLYWLMMMKFHSS